MLDLSAKDMKQKSVFWPEAVLTGHSVATGTELLGFRLSA